VVLNTAVFLVRLPVFGALIFITQIMRVLTEQCGLPVPPFEFRALEVALEAICSFLDARTTELETNAYPALDELTKKVRSNTEFN